MFQMFQMFHDFRELKVEFWQNTLLDLLLHNKFLNKRIYTYIYKINSIIYMEQITQIAVIHAQSCF